MGYRTIRSGVTLLLGIAGITGIFCKPSHAQTTASWLSAADGNWTDPLNWSSNPVYPNNGQPNPTDDYNVVINAVGGNYTVALPLVDTTIDSLSIASPNATLYQTGGTLTVLNGATISSGVYALDGGTFAGGALRINSDMEWFGGAMLAGGTTTIASGGILNAASSSFSGSLPTRTLARTLDNFGTINLRNGSIQVNGGTLINEVGGVINVDLPPLNLSGSPVGGLVGVGSSVISNLGQINYNGGTFSGILINSGTVTVGLTGALPLVNVTHNGNSVLDGPGTISLSGTQTLANGVTTFAGGRIDYYGTMSGPGDLNVTGQMNWNNGTIGGTGKMTIAPGAALNLGTDGKLYAKKIFDRRLDNHGVITVAAGSFGAYSSSALLNNLSDGVINVLPGGNLVAYNVGGTAPVNNQGTINLSIGTYTTLLPQTVNSGTIFVGSGTVYFGSGTHLTGSTVSGPGTVYLHDNYGGNGSHTFLGTGTLAGGNMILDQGTLQGSGNIMLAGTLHWNGGSITNAGGGTSNASITITPTGVLDVGPGSPNFVNLARPLYNDGVVNVNGGTIYLASNGTVTNEADGVINISPRSGIGPNFNTSILLNNFGTIHVLAGNSPQQGSGTFQFSPRMTNSGTIWADSGTVAFATSETDHLAGSTLAGLATIDLGSGLHLVSGTTTLAGANMFLGSASYTSGARIGGPGTINLTGTLNWTAGNIGSVGFGSLGPGSFIVGSTGVLNIDTQRSFRLLALQADNYGLVNFNDGTVSIQNVAFNNHTGGVLNISSAQNFIGSGTALLFNGGTVNLADASVTISVPFVNLGVINVVGGAAPLLSAEFTNGGTVNGSLNTDTQNVTLLDGAHGGSFIGDGVLTLDAGANASVQQVRQGTLRIRPAATLQLERNGGADGTSIVRLLQLDSPDGKLDLTDNHLIVDYDPLDPNPYSEIRAQIATGAIFSSLSDASDRIGYADNASRGLATFSGQPVDATSILIGYTFAGDSNLDGVVDVTDLGALATNWQSNGDWTQGDFNYDGVIDVTDLGALATNWQAGAGAGSAMSLEQALQTVGLGQMTIPEPRSVFEIGLCLLIAATLRVARRLREDVQSAPARNA